MDPLTPPALIHTVAQLGPLGLPVETKNSYILKAIDNTCIWYLINARYTVYVIDKTLLTTDMMVHLPQLYLFFEIEFVLFYSF